jgi:hypothetical protein
MVERALARNRGFSLGVSGILVTNTDSFVAVAAPRNQGPRRRAN